jgi:UPF0176 protein
MSQLTIAAYQFIPIQDPSSLREGIKNLCQELGLRGTILLAHEGINSFVAGPADSIHQLKNYLENDLGFKGLCYKEHPCDTIPFTRLLVKVKKEIIAMGVAGIEPHEFTAPHLSPLDLKKWLDEKQDVVLLDTRNDYEISVGTFKNAIHLNISTFKKFPEAAIRQLKDLKNKKIVTYCTGGIRCEKASAFLVQNGFTDVYQLDGGILKYFEDCDSAHYGGNCFVFDWRLAVNSQLKAEPRSPVNTESFGRHILKDTVPAESSTE